jgi:hypothetical protein
MGNGSEFWTYFESKIRCTKAFGCVMTERTELRATPRLSSEETGKMRLPFPEI